MAFLNVTIGDSRVRRFEDPIADQIADLLSAGDPGFAFGCFTLRAFRRVANKVLENTRAAGLAVERIERERVSLASLLTDHEASEDWTLVYIHYNLFDD
jgi:hypothetical protein